MEQENNIEKKVFDDGTRREVHFTFTNVTTTEEGKKILDPYRIPSYPLEEKNFKDILIENGIAIFSFCFLLAVVLLYMYSISLVYNIFGGTATLVYIPISVWLLYSTFQYFFTDRRIL